MVDSNSPSSLLCFETEKDLNNEEDDGELNEYMPGRHEDYYYEEDYLHILFLKEMRDFELDYRQCSLSDWIKSVRSDSIRWILNTRVLLGFRLQTAYLSVIYFDRFLSRRMIDNEKQWAVRLLAVACLSLAGKMEEFKVPALSEFRWEEHSFESKVIQRMEILVLNTLEWRMVSVTPFDYLGYFVSKLCLQQSSQRNVLYRTIDLIFAITKDINLARHRSSSIAIAATLVAMDLNLTRETLEIQMNDIPINRCTELEDVLSCYNGLRERNNLHNFATSPELSPLGRTVFRVSSSVSSKRKRLTFSDSKQGMPEEKRHPHC